MKHSYKHLCKDRYGLSAKFKFCPVLRTRSYDYANSSHKTIACAEQFYLFGFSIKTPTQYCMLMKV